MRFYCRFPSTFRRFRRLAERVSVWAACASVSFAIPATAHADVTAAVAANFLPTAREIAALYEERYGETVRLVSGSSGKLTAMILNGAPIDVFLSADTERPDALEQAGLVADRETYAFGRLALFAPATRSDEEALSVLTEARFRRLAIAEPRLAPYGRAAMDVLAHLGLSETLGDKLAIGENIGQTFGFVATGNAEIGLVALSQVLDPMGTVPAGTHVLPASYHAPIRQDVVLLTEAADNPSALAFFALLVEEETRNVIRDRGYEVPAQ